MNRLAVYLNRHIDGVVYSAPDILTGKATDRSPLSYYPRLVATPVHTLDVRRLLRFSYQLTNKNINLPISVRGAGLDKGGADLGSGLIIDTSKLNHIQEIDPLQRLVRVQVGVRLGELRNALLLQGLDFPVIGDPRETIGDLVARRASAYKDAKPATIADFITNAEVVFTDGSYAELMPFSKLRLNAKKQDESFCLSAYRQLAALYAKKHNELGAADPLHNRMGYAGFADFAKKYTHYDMISLLCGSENSLAVPTELILRVEAVYDPGKRVAVVCRNSHEYLKASRVMKKIGISDLFVYDTELFNEIDNTGKSSRFFRKASDDGYLIVGQIKDDSGCLRAYKMNSLKREIGKSQRLIIENDDNAIDFDRLPENLDAYLNDSTKNNFRSPLVDGVYVPEAQQVQFLNSIIKLSDKYGCKLAVYGYPAFDSFSLRPNLSTATADGRRKLISFMREYLDLVNRCGGNPCGDAAEGRWLPIFANRYRSAESLAIDGEIKKIFDQHDILSPGIKQEADLKTILRHFRTDHNQETISQH